MAPAQQRSFVGDDPPEHVLLDTSFVVAALVSGEVHHDACLDFASRLQAAGSAIVYSSLLRIEYFNTWRKLIGQGLLPPEPSDQLRMSLDIPEARPYWFRVTDRLLSRFLAQFPRREVRLNRRVLRSMVALMGTYNLQAMDAAQVASALDMGCQDIASLDDDFKRVQGIRLWLP